VRAVTEVEAVAGLPIGTRVELDADTVVHPDGTISGGSPVRRFRLNGRARTALSELLSGTVTSLDGAGLGRRLSDAGLLHPRPGTSPRPQYAGQVTVVIPVRDRVDELDACLGGLLGPGSEPWVTAVVVVDDGSADAAALARVAGRHGARLIHRRVNGGPGAARNTGLEQVHTEFVAFCDSDCRPGPTWIPSLLGHFDDPLVAAVAPRVVPAAPGAHLDAGHPPAEGWAARYARAKPALDLGSRPARVAPMSRVAYLPTAAMVVRCSALAGGTRAFDESLRYGEDVDLVWRLLAAGWRVRFDPSVQVPHAEPERWGPLLRRRFAYGTSAAALEERHPGQVAPLVLAAGPAATVAALLARKPLLAAAAFAVGYLDLRETLRRAGQPHDGAARKLAEGVVETFEGAGRWAAQFGAPLVIAALAAPFGSGRTRLARRAVTLALVTAPPLRQWWRDRPDLDPLTWTAAVLVDDAAYGAGVWAGSLRAGHLRAVRPQWHWRLVRIRRRASG
jgi:mycofactocin system glycosyltransferase